MSTLFVLFSFILTQFDGKSHHIISKHVRLLFLLPFSSNFFAELHNQKIKKQKNSKRKFKSRKQFQELVCYPKDTTTMYLRTYYLNNSSTSCIVFGYKQQKTEWYTLNAMEWLLISFIVNSYNNTNIYIYNNITGIIFISGFVLFVAPVLLVLWYVTIQPFVLVSISI